jgi:hypothetical protein
VLVITNTSDLPGVRIPDSCTDRGCYIFSCQFCHNDVEPVDPLSTDEANKSIGVDMLDHDR